MPNFKKFNVLTLVNLEKTLTKLYLELTINTEYLFFFYISLLPWHKSVVLNNHRPDLIHEAMSFHLWDSPEISGRSKI